MTEIVTIASTAANSVPAFPYPVLEAGNMSFPEGQYVVDFSPANDPGSYALKHRVEGAPLLERLIAEHVASFACIVSSPRSAYRRLWIAKNASQKISWNPGDLAEAPLFKPLLLASADHQITLRAERDGVHPVWDRCRITIPEAARLAVGNVVRLEASLHQLLHIRPYDDIHPGGFRVLHKAEPFAFEVQVAPDLFERKVKQPSSPTESYEFRIHIATACLAYLHRNRRAVMPSSNDVDDPDASLDRGLQALDAALAEKNAGSWQDDDGFEPERAATLLYPYPEATDDTNEWEID